MAKPNKFESAVLNIAAWGDDASPKVLEKPGFDQDESGVDCDKNWKHILERIRRYENPIDYLNG